LPAPRRLSPARQIRWESALTLPQAAEEFIDFTVNPDEPDDLLASRSALGAAIGPVQLHHQLLGWPHLLQGSMHWQCQEESGAAAGLPAPEWDELLAGTQAADWQLLLQLGSDETYDARWCWGDAGALYFWIRRADLVARRFGNVWTVLQG
jgi:hypothetical protein